MSLDMETKQEHTDKLRKKKIKQDITQSGGVKWQKMGCKRCDVVFILYKYIYYKKNFCKS